MFREGLARSLESEPDMRVAGQFASGADALRSLDSAACDIVLLDVDLGPEKAIDFVNAARVTGYPGPILIVTAGISGQEALRLVESGVAGILHKQHSTRELCATIRKVIAGDVCLEENYLSSLFRAVDRSRPAAGPKLTERDRTVLRLILQGLTNREIAARLEVAESAVKAALRQVCAKLSVHTRSQLVKVAIEQYRDQL